MLCRCILIVFYIFCYLGSGLTFTRDTTLRVSRSVNILKRPDRRLWSNNSRFFFNLDDVSHWWLRSVNNSSNFSFYRPPLILILFSAHQHLFLCLLHSFRLKLNNSKNLLTNCRFFLRLSKSVLLTTTHKKWSVLKRVETTIN